MLSACSVAAEQRPGEPLTRLRRSLSRFAQYGALITLMAHAAPHLRLIPPLPSAALPGTADPTAARSDPAAVALVAEHARPAVAEPLTLATLFQEHARYVATVVLRVLGRDQEVDDVVQEVFLTAMTGLSAVRSPEAVRGWLKTIAVRKAFRYLRRRRLRVLLGFDRESPCYEHLAAPGCSPEESALLARVYRELDRLPAAERLAWTLRYVEGEQVEALAGLCGCSLATAKRRIAAAQAKLGRTLGHDR
jgi:RNA polymerase sigma-70 factor (ECF subfamily)